MELMQIDARLNSGGKTAGSFRGRADSGGA
jgi:hypothetical protein